MIQLDLSNLKLPTSSLQTSLESQFKVSSFIPPELYYFLPFVSEADKIPKWVSNSSDSKPNVWEIIYKHRLLFESPKVTQKLHIWIDKLWGENSKYHNVVLFHKPPPPQPHIDALRPPSQTFEIVPNNPDDKVLFSAVTHHYFSTIIISVIFSSGAINSYIILFGNGNIPSKLEVNQLKVSFSFSQSDYFKKKQSYLSTYKNSLNYTQSSNDKAENNSSDLYKFNCNSNKIIQVQLAETKNSLKSYDTFSINDYLSDKGNINFFNLSSNKIYTFSKELGKMELFIDQYSNPSIQKKEFFSETDLFFPLSEFSILYCPNQYTVAIYEDHQSLHPLLVTPKPIRKLGVHKSFHIFSIAHDNEVSLYSLRTGRKIKSIELFSKSSNSNTYNDTINQLLFTDKWGMLVIATNKEIIIINTEGKLLKRIQKENPKIFAMSTKEGHDYIAFQDNNNIRIFEVMYPEKQSTVLETSQTLNLIYYDSKHKVFLIILGNNHIIIVPNTFF